MRQIPKEYRVETNSNISSRGFSHTTLNIGQIVKTQKQLEILDLDYSLDKMEQK